MRVSSGTVPPSLPPASSGICSFQKPGCGSDRATKATFLQATATCWVFTHWGRVRGGGRCPFPSVCGVPPLAPQGLGFSLPPN